MSRQSDRPVDLSVAVDPVLAFRKAASVEAPVLLRTSGSAVGVVRSTYSWISSFPHVSRLAGIGPGSRVWVPGSRAASMNVFARVHASYAGAALVDAAEGVGHATHAALTPSQLGTLLDRPPPRGLTVVVAGDRLAPALYDRASAEGLVVHHYYGAAELSFVAWGPHSEGLRPFPGVEAVVRDSEIWVRSDYLCQGYDGAPGPLRRTPDGFATVGDRGVLHRDRLLVDGRPDAVTTGGATVLVAGVERVLRAHARGEVIVTGAPHARLGEVLVALVTDPADRPRLVESARESLPPAGRPRIWLHVPTLPVTGAGKLDRPAVARLAADSVRARPGAARRLT